MESQIDFESLQQGFQNLVSDSQSAFRTILDGFSNPGTIQTVTAQLCPPKGIDNATAAVCLTLFDHDSKVWLDGDKNKMLADWLRFHCQCPLTKNSKLADFGIVVDAEKLQMLDGFNIGSSERPDLSTTLIIQVEDLEVSKCFELCGPGIENHVDFGVSGIGSAFWASRDRLFSQFPLGIDMIFTHRNALVALPRTTKLKGA